MPLSSPDIFSYVISNSHYLIFGLLLTIWLIGVLMTKKIGGLVISNNVKKIVKLVLIVFLTVWLAGGGLKLYEWQNMYYLDLNNIEIIKIRKLSGFPILIDSNYVEIKDDNRIKTAFAKLQVLLPGKLNHVGLKHGFLVEIKLKNEKLYESLQFQVYSEVGSSKYRSGVKSDIVKIKGCFFEHGTYSSLQFASFVESEYNSAQEYKSRSKSQNNNRSLKP